jgi:hypothetical protein
VAGAADLFRRGLEALQEGDYADAASLFRLSYDMERSSATICNLATTYDRWAGHQADAIAAYERCAAEDQLGRFRAEALERLRILRGAASGASAPATTASGAAAPSQTRIALSWTVTSQTSGCFFFSGPGSTGQRDRLGNAAVWQSAGTSVSLTFGPGLVFQGTRTGDRVALARRSVHQYGSGRWIVDETIAGEFVGTVLQAEYGYRECDETRTQGCPTRCVLAARMSALPAGR